MASQRVIITGAGGFVGGYLSKAVKSSKDLHLCDFIDPLTGQKVDLRHEQSVTRAIAHAKPDIVFHLAGIAAPRSANDHPIVAWQVNVMGTAHIAHAILKHAPNAHLIWAGSAEAYGISFNQSEHAIDETASLQPTSSYGATKAASDIMLRQLAHKGLNVTICRPFNHTGAGQSDTYVASAFAKQIAAIETGAQEPVLKVGNLDACRDFLDVADVISAYLACARAQNISSGRAYNISTGRPVKIETLLIMLKELSQSPFEIVVDQDRYAANITPICSGNPAKALQDLGWQPSIPLQTTLKDVLSYWRGEPQLAT